MIIHQFHLQPQFIYELFHINFTSLQIFFAARTAFKIREYHSDIRFISTPLFPPEPLFSTRPCVHTPCSDPVTRDPGPVFSIYLSVWRKLTMGEKSGFFLKGIRKLGTFIPPFYPTASFPGLLPLKLGGGVVRRPKF